MNPRFVSPLLFLCSLLAAPAAIVRGPYLQSATPTSIVVRWRTDAPTASAVHYGPAGGAPDRVAEGEGPTTEHVVTLNDLTPDADCRYAIDGAGEHTFHTPPPAGPARPFRLWVLGDPGTGDDRARSVRDAYLDFTRDHRADLCLLLGDNAYPDGTDANYQRGFFDTYPDILASLPLWPSLGNHDTHSAKSGSQSGPYFEIFTVPTRGEAGGVPSGTEAYYSFNYANVHFISLDTSDSNRAPDGPMLKWLKADMAATKQLWIVAFFHHPPYTKGNHDSDDPRNHDLFEVRNQILPMLEAGGVDLILAGHSHVYERSGFVDGYYGTSADFDAARDLKQTGTGRPEEGGAYVKPLARTPHAGEVVVVAGSSGKVPPPKGATLDHPVMVCAYRELGSLVIDVDGPLIDVRFLTGGGTLHDHFQLRKE